jgi:organic hydroperoxide reductase OsmC/OhrA
MGSLHTFEAGLTWTGAGATGTSTYTAYSRDHDVTFTGRPSLPGSADPAFRGDPTRYSPEELLVAALAQCHMLWFLHLAAADGVVVVGYTDDALGTMRVESGGGGQFTEVVLHPQVTVAHAVGTDARLLELHTAAHEHCFIARSVNFPVRVDPGPVRPAQPTA